jgi:hypothetical protein
VSSVPFARLKSVRKNTTFNRGDAVFAEILGILASAISAVSAVQDFFTASGVAAC